MTSHAVDQSHDDDCWHTLHVSPDSEIAIVRALLRWGEVKCQRSLEHLKSLDLPIVNHLLSATANVAGRIGLQGWVDSIVQCCDPLTTSLDKFLAHKLLTTLAFALDQQSSHAESGHVRDMEDRIMQLEHHVEELHTTLLLEKHSKKQLSQDLNQAQQMTKEATARAENLDVELDQLKRTMVKEQETMAKGFIDEIGQLQGQLDESNRQCGRLQDDNSALTAKLKQTEQKLMWSMLFLTVRSQHGLKAMGSIAAKA